MEENSHPTVTPDTIGSETEQKDDASIEHGTDPKTHFNLSSASSSDKPSLSHAALKGMVNDDGYLTPEAVAEQTGYSEIKSKVELDRAVLAYGWTQGKIGFEHQYFPPPE